ncbi:MAG TPA: S41 family peptidase [Phycisphaerae bacterium]|nr:S41 family peptidase [Phycisphaerales bacterium]HNO79828.1 S41 family peptidase [Phycisphaerae bacterium]
MTGKRSRVLNLWSFAAAAVLLFGSVTTSLAKEPDDTTRASALDSNKTWNASLEHIRHGQYREAEDLLKRLANRSGMPEKANQWVADWIESEKNRQELTQQDYESYVKRATKEFAKPEDERDYNDALKWTYWAMLNTLDQDTFKHLEWVQELKEAATHKADKLRREHEWRDSHAIYYSLSIVFENDTDIEKGRRECLEHVRLDEIYKKRDDYDWTESLEGITKSTVEEALWRIDQKYVEEADFKAMTAAGFQELLLLAESPTLRDQFEGLKNESGEDYVNRLSNRYAQIQKSDKLSYREALQHFRRALKINRQTAQLPEEMVIKEYMSAALEELDEFSSMIWPSDFREFEKHTRGDFVGVGIQIRNKYNPELKDNEILVVSPLDDAPAYRAGILAEDIITNVNGESLLGVPVTKAVGLITGPLGTTVTLTIRRENTDGEVKTFDVPLKREIVKIQSVKSHHRRDDNEEQWNFLLDDELGVGYVRVGAFQENTVEQLRLALSEATNNGMKGLILDLRFNPGGLLKSAVEMSELFLDRGDRIVSTKGLRSPEWAVDAEGSGEFKDLPLIVLINESSASASEIVSGAIRDQHRGLILGERSFGKFSVQNLIQLAHSEAHLKLTTARYYLPSGKSLHREKGSETWGVEPDITIPLAPKELSKVLFMRRDADVLGSVKTSSEDEIKEKVKPRDNDDKDKEDTAKNDEDDDVDVNNRPRRDPQLETALLVMRLHLLNNQMVQMADMTPTPVETKVKVAHE